MSLSAYLYFDGECADAFEFYKSVFGGDYAAFMRFSDGPSDFKYDEADKEKVMHVTLPVGSSVLMGSDVAKGYGETPKPANSFAISYAPETKAEADRVFNALHADGGAVTMALEEAFWGSYFGMCKDKFGVHWMVNFDLGQR